MEDSRDRDGKDKASRRARGAMRTLLVLAALALALTAVPVAAAEHGCVGDPNVVALCGWHNGPYECYVWYYDGEPVEGTRFC